MGIVDGEPLDVTKSVVYRGHMFSDVPNAAISFGYTNASWTLRADLTWQSVCRLLNHMRDHGYTSATPVYDGDPDAGGSVFGLSSGYVQRAADQLPKQGTAQPWIVRQNYLRDVATFRHGEIEESIEFSKAPALAEDGERAAA